MSKRTRRAEAAHEHIAIWVCSDNMPGFLVLRCNCGETFGTKRLPK